MLIMTTGLMEFSFIFAVITGLITFLASPFPFVQALVTFWSAFLIGFVTQGRRVIWQVLGYFLAWLMVFLYSFQVFINAESFHLSSLWSIMVGPKDVKEWFIFCLFFGSSVGLWIGGWLFFRRPLDYRTICNRFDVGIGAFFFLFLIQAGVDIQEPVYYYLLLAFFLFSVLSIGLARAQGKGKRVYLQGYRGIGPLLSFAALILFGGVSAALLFLPYMTMAAQKGFEVLKGVGNAITPFLLAIVRFLFGFGFRPDTSSNITPPDELGLVPPVEPGPMASLIERILSWGLIGFVVLAILVFLGWGVYRLIGWLLSQPPEERSFFWIQVRTWIIDQWNRIVSRFRRRRYSRPSVVYYRNLLRWGRVSGVGLQEWETPWEYGHRLSCRFPQLEREIKVIVDAFCTEAYGTKLLPKHKSVHVKEAWSILRSPVQWASRLQVLVRDGRSGLDYPTWSE
jgi:hypothetical protein